MINQLQKTLLNDFKYNNRKRQNYINTQKVPNTDVADARLTFNFDLKLLL